jgi:alpha-glucosidase
VHDIIARMRGVLDEYGEKMMVGETYLPLERLMTYYGAQGSGVHLPFNFQLIELPWHARVIGDAIDRYEAALPSFGWPNWVLGNHDNPRIASRIGAAQARVAAMLLLTLRGMHNVPIPPDRVQDPFEKNVPGLGLGRDPARTPMQWSAAANAGFTRGQPWLPVAEDFPTRNVEVQSGDATSMLALYRQLISLRRRRPALSIGEYVPVPASGDLLSYRRAFDNLVRLIIILNFGTEASRFSMTTGTFRGRVALSTHLDRVGESVGEQIALRPDEGVVLELVE